MANGSDNSLTDEARDDDRQSKLPTIDLEEAIRIAGAIRSKALENAKMDDVAKGLGYANQSSTPFYNRINAARMFGLLAGKSTVSPRMLTYLKPHREDAKAVALREAILGIPAYAKIIEQYLGKKLNTALLANWIETEYGVAESKTLICARIFERSVKFAGMLASDGSVQTSQSVSEQTGALPEAPPETQVLPLPSPTSEPRTAPSGAMQQQTMYGIGKEKNLTFAFTGPREVGKADYDLICLWLRCVLHVPAKDEVTEDTQ
jgi:hypothetical protein